MKYIFCIFILILSADVLAEESVIYESLPPPGAEWIEGFEQGVRWGLIAFLQNPEESHIPTITDEAKKLYYFYIVHQAKSALEKYNEELEKEPK